jgi:hypothetical protein
LLRRKGRLDKNWFFLPIRAVWVFLDWLILVLHGKIQVAKTLIQFHFVCFFLLEQKCLIVADVFLLQFFAVAQIHFVNWVQWLSFAVVHILEFESQFSFVESPHKNQGFDQLSAIAPKNFLIANLLATRRDCVHSAHHQVTTIAIF